MALDAKGLEDRLMRGDIWPMRSADIAFRAQKSSAGQGRNWHVLPGARPEWLPAQAQEGWWPRSRSQCHFWAPLAFQFPPLAFQCLRRS